MTVLPRNPKGRTTCGLVLFRGIVQRLPRIRRARSGTTRTLRLTILTVVAGAIVTDVSGCSWQQAYLSAQGWQRNACYRLPDEAERERCLRNAGMTYDDYRRRSEGAKQD